MIPQATIDELRRLLNEQTVTTDKRECDAAKRRCKIIRVMCLHGPDLLDEAERALRMEAVLRNIRERCYLRGDDRTVEHIDAALKDQP